MSAPELAPDLSDERLKRAGYLRIACADRLVPALAALVGRVCRSAVKLAVMRRHTGARPSATGTIA